MIGIIFFAALAIVFFTIAGATLSNEDSTQGIVIFIFGLVFLATATLGTVIESEKVFYKEGQVDALTGKIQYHLITKSDSTKSWVEIKE